MATVATEGSNDVPLLKDEVGGLMYEEGIATISFYKGDFQKASDALRAQLAAVVAANPWLVGRLVKSKAGVVMRHPVKPSDQHVGSIFVSTSAKAEGAFKLKPSAPYVEICSEMFKSKKVIVGNGGSLLGKDIPLTLLTLAELEEGSFALIFSISHVIGDGRTYYEIFKMLQVIERDCYGSWCEERKTDAVRKAARGVKQVPNAVLMSLSISRRSLGRRCGRSTPLGSCRIPRP